MNKSLIIARKEFTDAITSKKFWLIIGLFLLFYAASIYATSFGFRIGGGAPARPILQITSNVVTTMAFLAPILGIALAFDTISGERERGSLRILLSRPIYREDVINGKIISALAVIGLTITASSLFSVSVSILLHGISVTLDDIVRICFFIVLSILFSFAYYSISLFISTFSSKSGHSLTISLGIWIFFAFILGILSTVIASVILGAPPVTPGSFIVNRTQGGFNRTERISESYLNYSRREAQITNTIQMLSINYHYSQIANSLFGSTFSPFGQQATQLSLSGLLTSRWIDLLVLIVFPLIFSVASYAMFTRTQEK